jgi:hypothetical protein
VASRSNSSSIHLLKAAAGSTAVAESSLHHAPVARLSSRARDSQEAPCSYCPACCRPVNGDDCCWMFLLLWLCP